MIVLMNQLCLASMVAACQALSAGTMKIELNTPGSMLGQMCQSIVWYLNIADGVVERQLSCMTRRLASASGT